MTVGRYTNSLSLAVATMELRLCRVQINAQTISVDQKLMAASQFYQTFQKSDFSVQNNSWSSILAIFFFSFFFTNTSVNHSIKLTAALKGLFHPIEHSYAKEQKLKILDLVLFINDQQICLGNLFIFFLTLKFWIAR